MIPGRPPELEWLSGVGHDTGGLAYKNVSSWLNLDDRKSKKQKKKEQRRGKSGEPRKDDKGSQEKKCLSDKTNLTERRNVLVKTKRVDRESKKGRSAENEGGEPLPKRKRDDVYTEEDKVTFIHYNL